MWSLDRVGSRGVKGFFLVVVCKEKISGRMGGSECFL